MAVLLLGTLVVMGSPGSNPEPTAVTIRNGKTKVDPKSASKTAPKTETVPAEEKEVRSTIPRADAEHAVRVLNIIGAVGALGFCQIVGAIPENISVKDVIPKLVEISKGYEARNDGLTNIAKYAPQLFAHALEGHFVNHTLKEDGVTVHRTVTQISNPEMCKVIEEIVKKEQAPGGVIAGVGLPGRAAIINPKQ